MYSIYIDETGINENCTILSGVILHEKDYLNLCKDIDILLLRIFKTKSITLKELRRKTYSECIFEERQYAEFTEQYYNLLERYHPTFIITGVENSYLSNKNDKIKKCYKMLLERFHSFLIKRKGYGQVVYDKGHYFTSICEEHKQLMISGSSWGWNYEYINNIYNQKDEDCRLLQVADMLAHSAYRHFNRKDSRHFKRCYPFFDKDTRGVIEGFGVKILK